MKTISRTLVSLRYNLPLTTGSGTRQLVSFKKILHVVFFTRWVKKKKKKKAKHPVEHFMRQFFYRGLITHSHHKYPEPSKIFFSHYYFSHWDIVGKADYSKFWSWGEILPLNTHFLLIEKKYFCFTF